MNQKLFFFPPYAKKEEGNPYTRNFKESLSQYFEVIDKDTIFPKRRRNVLLKKSFSADIYIFNWVESIKPRWSSILLYLPTILSILIIWLRRKKIIWILHNLEPHEGKSFYSETIMSLLYKHSYCIITHSKEAYNKAILIAKAPVYYRCHPIKQIQIVPKELGESFDIFIWGAILPYKGIPEFLKHLNEEFKQRVLILGKCNDDLLNSRILNECSTRSNVVFDNRRADMDEIAYYCKRSKYVLFPYLEGSVSSSGALIDTIVLGGNPIGPNVGAFKDLAEDGLCTVYEDYDELIKKLNIPIKVNQSNYESFLRNNTWDLFTKNIYRLVNNNNNE